jgi:hypothetical protein
VKLLGLGSMVSLCPAKPRQIEAGLWCRVMSGAGLEQPLQRSFLRRFSRLPTQYEGEVIPVIVAAMDGLSASTSSPADELQPALSQLLRSLAE